MISPATQIRSKTTVPSFLDRPVDRGLSKTLLNAIEVMTATDIEAVVALHQQEIPGGVFTELGRDFLILFYRQIITSQYGLGYVVKKDRHVIGFITGCSNADAFFRQLYTRFFFRTGLIVLKRIMVQPSFFPRFMQRVFLNQYNNKYAESLAGAVRKDYQTNGYGVVLLRKLIDDLRRLGVNRIQCVVVEEADNPDTVRLHRMYKKGGYKPIGEFRVGTLKYIRYRRQL